MDALMGDVTTYVHFSVMMIAVCLAATICLLFSMRSSIIRPIRQMTHDMKTVTDASGIIRPTEAEELNVLSTSVNQMLHKLRDMQKQELVHPQKYYQMNMEKTQAEMIEVILPRLTEEEADIYRRGRNAKSHPPKNADVIDYKLATGVETLLGHLYIKGDVARISELMTHLFK